MANILNGAFRRLQNIDAYPDEKIEGLDDIFWWCEKYLFPNLEAL